MNGKRSRAIRKHLFGGGSPSVLPRPARKAYRQFKKLRNRRDQGPKSVVIKASCKRYLAKKRLIQKQAIAS